jgi:uncharacterized protein YfiM (DUF2279 family)
MTTPTPPLSSAAQAVSDAAHDAWVTEDHASSIAAAALIAAADQVVPEEQEPAPNEDSVVEMQLWSAVAQRQRTRSQLLAIATKLRQEVGE